MSDTTTPTARVGRSFIVSSRHFFYLGRSVQIIVQGPADFVNTFEALAADFATEAITINPNEK